jgi:hypothetical protein
MADSSAVDSSVDGLALSGLALRSGLVLRSGLLDGGRLGGGRLGGLHVMHARYSLLGELVCVSFYRPCAVSPGTMVLGAKHSECHGPVVERV